MNEVTLPNICDMKKKILYRIWKLVDDKYVLFDEKKINWNNIFVYYNKLLKKVDCYDKLYELIDHMLLELRDPHTRVVFSPYKKVNGMIPLILACIDDGYYVKENLCSNKLTKGMLVLSINDNPIKKLESRLYNKYKFQSKSHMNTLFLKELNDGNFGHCLKVKATADFQNEVIEKVYFQYFDDKELNSSIIESMKKSLSLCQICEYNNIGYVRIQSFRNKCVLNDLEEAIFKFKKKEALIIDIRGNDGGLIECASEAAGFFTKDEIIVGYKIQRRLEGTHNEFIPPTEIRILPKNNTNEYKKIVILCDEFTMSSAEFIFLNSLRGSSNKISIVGKKTGGLAHGASIYTLFDGTKIQITTSKYLNIQRNVIAEEGIYPDFEISNTKQFILENKDKQLDYALSLCEKYDYLFI